MWERIFRRATNAAGKSGRITGSRITGPVIQTDFPAAFVAQRKICSHKKPRRSWVRDHWGHRVCLDQPPASSRAHGQCRQKPARPDPHESEPESLLARTVPVALLREQAGGDPHPAYALLLGVARLHPPQTAARWDEAHRPLLRGPWTPRVKGRSSAARRPPAPHARTPPNRCAPHPPARRPWGGGACSQAYCLSGARAVERRRQHGTLGGLRWISVGGGRARL